MGLEADVVRKCEAGCVVNCGDRAVPGFGKPRGGRVGGDGESSLFKSGS